MAALKDMGIQSIPKLDAKKIKNWLQCDKKPISIPSCSQEQLISEILALSESGTLKK